MNHFRGGVSLRPLIVHDVMRCRVDQNVFDACQVLAIVKHGGERLASNLCYLDTFQMCTRHADSLRYIAFRCSQTLCALFATFCN